MLANGIKLGYADKKGGAIKWLKNLQEVPELGAVPERVDTTHLESTQKEYEQGIGDTPEMNYKFLYKTKGDYDELEQLSSTTVKHWVQKFPDGLAYGFDATAAVKLSGGGVNGVITYTLTLYNEGPVARETISASH